MMKILFQLQANINHEIMVAGALLKRTIKYKRF